MTLDEAKRIIGAMTEHMEELRRMITYLELENNELKEKLKKENKNAQQTS